MANIVITYVAGKIIEFEYNALYKNGVLQEIQDIHEFHLFLIEKTEGDPSTIVVKYQYEGKVEYFSFDGVNGLQVDSVGGAMPTTNLDLYNKLRAIKIS